MNKLYISPEFEILRVEILDEVLSASPESTGGSTIGGNDWSDWGTGYEDEDW